MISAKPVRTPASPVSPVASSTSRLAVGVVTKHIAAAIATNVTASMTTTAQPAERSGIVDLPEHCLHSCDHEDRPQSITGHRQKRQQRQQRQKRQQRQQRQQGDSPLLRQMDVSLA